MSPLTPNIIIRAKCLFKSPSRVRCSRVPHSLCAVAAATAVAAGMKNAPRKPMPVRTHKRLWNSNYFPSKQTLCQWNAAPAIETHTHSNASAILCKCLIFQFAWSSSSSACVCVSLALPFGVVIGLGQFFASHNFHLFVLFSLTCFVCCLSFGRSTTCPKRIFLLIKYSFAFIKAQRECPTLK